MNVAYNMDCVDLMAEIESDQIDLTVTSPPYDNLRDYGGYKFDAETTIKELYRITKVGGVVVWICADQTANGSETLSSFKQAIIAHDAGFNVHDTMIWRKDTSAFPERVRYNQIFEYMFVWSKGKPATVNLIRDRKNKYAGCNIHGTIRQKNGETVKRNDQWCETKCAEFGARFNVWDIPTEKNNKTGHPAVFPYQLARDHILTWSDENDLVFDPFLGSGTTRIAAYDTNRSFIGCEIDVEYFKKQEKRFAEHSAQLNLFLGG